MCYALSKTVNTCMHFFDVVLLELFWTFVNFIFISLNMTCNPGKGSVVTGNCMMNLKSKHKVL